METILEAGNLVKTYPGIKAVDGIGFKIDSGSCYGLLGPNGAGKTTTMEMLEGIIRPDEGDVFYRGQRVDERFKHEIGIQFQTTSLQDFQTVHEALLMFSSLYETTADLQKLIELCHLREFIDRDTRKLSGGQRQRLLLAIALVNDPKLVFLDEPTTGLDPQSRRNFWSLIEGIKQEGKTILLTTHYMEEAYRLCDRIAIVDRGRIIIEGNPDALLQLHFASTVIRLPQQAAKEPDSLPDDIQLVDGYYELFTDDVPESIARLEQLGFGLGDCHISAPTLEDLFLKLTGHALRT
jgi:ABC-2 type transport system ATP-binding protein